MVLELIHNPNVKFILPHEGCMSVCLIVQSGYNEGVIST